MGFVFAAAFLLFARPTGLSLLLSLPLVLGGLALRGYAAGYVKKNAELTTTGPYGVTRNPLYLGSIGIALGFGIASANPWLLLALAVLFTLIYIPTIQGEEQYLRATFPGYDAYAARVPRLVPRALRRPRSRQAPDDSAGTAGRRARFSTERYRHHREYNAGMGAAALYLVLLLRLVWFAHGFAPVPDSSLPAPHQARPSPTLMRPNR